MSDYIEFAVRAVLIGAGATIILDIWSLFLNRAFGLAPTNWAMVGRWIGHFPRGRFTHQSIAAAAPVAGELALGWATHYVVGVVYAGMLLALCGPEWTRAPTLLPALAFGIATVVAPFFILQPGMGAGVMASRTPNPNAARLRALTAHAVFGIGLYLAALATAQLMPG